MKSNRNDTYREFLSRAQYYSQIKLPDLADIFPFYSFFNHSLLSPIAFYIIDYVNCKYVFLKMDNLQTLGFSNKYITDGGPHFIVDLFHPYDFRIFNEIIFQANLNATRQSLISNRNDLLFKMNFRIRSRSGKYINLIQRSRYLSFSLDGTPLAAAGCILDVSPYVHDAKMVHTIEMHHEDFGIQVLSENVYFPEDGMNILTKREVEVLKWVCEGYSSKQIADKLYLSIHTINNHRKNMLEKTHCKNLSELLNHAIKEGMLRN